MATINEMKFLRGVRITLDDGSHFYAPYTVVTQILGLTDLIDERVKDINDLISPEQLQELTDIVNANKTLFDDFVTSQTLANASLTASITANTNKINDDIQSLKNNEIKALEGDIQTNKDNIDIVNTTLVDYQRQISVNEEAIIVNRAELVKINELFDAYTNTNRFEKYDSFDDITDPQLNVIYLIPNDKGVLDEYIWFDFKWERIGSTDFDATGLVTEDWVNSKLDVINASIANLTDKDTALESRIEVLEKKPSTDTSGVQKLIDESIKDLTTKTYVDDKVTEINDKAAFVDKENTFTEEQTFNNGIKANSEVGLCLSPEGVEDESLCTTIRAYTSGDGDNEVLITETTMKGNYNFNTNNHDVTVDNEKVSTEKYVDNKHEVFTTYKTANEITVAEIKAEILALQSISSVIVDLTSDDVLDEQIKDPKYIYWVPTAISTIFNQTRWSDTLNDWIDLGTTEAALKDYIKTNDTITLINASEDTINARIDQVEAASGITETRAIELIDNKTKTFVSETVIDDKISIAIDAIPQGTDEDKVNELIDEKLEAFLPAEVGDIDSEYEPISNVFTIAANSFLEVPLLDGVNIEQYSPPILATNNGTNVAWGNVILMNENGFNVRNLSEVSAISGAYLAAKKNKGFKGDTGEDGADGKSFIDAWLELNPGKTEEDLIEEIKKPLTNYEAEWEQISEEIDCAPANIVTAPLLEGINIDEYNSFTFKNTGPSSVRAYVNIGNDGHLRIGNASTTTTATGYIVAKKNYGVENKTISEEWLELNPGKTYDDFLDTFEIALDSPESVYEAVGTLPAIAANGVGDMVPYAGINLHDYHDFIALNSNLSFTRIFFKDDSAEHPEIDYLRFKNVGTGTVAAGALVHAIKNKSVQNDTFIDDWLVKNPDKTYEDLYNEMKKPLNVYGTEWVQLTENVASIAANATAYTTFLEGINIDEYGSLIVRQSNGFTATNPAACFTIYSAVGDLGIRTVLAATNVSVWGKKLYGVENKTIKEEWLDDNEGKTESDFYEEMKKPLNVYDSEWEVLAGPFSIAAGTLASIDLGDKIKEYNSFTAGGTSSSSSYGYVSTSLGYDKNIIYIRFNGTSGTASGIYLYGKKNYGVQNKTVKEEWLDDNPGKTDDQFYEYMKSGTSCVKFLTVDSNNNSTLSLAYLDSITEGLGECMIYVDPKDGFMGSYSSATDYNGKVYAGSDLRFRKSSDGSYTLLNDAEAGQVSIKLSRAVPYTGTIYLVKDGANSAYTAGFLITIIHSSTGTEFDKLESKYNALLARLEALENK